MKRSFRTTRGSLGDPRGTLGKKAEKMLRQNEATEKAGQRASATSVRLDRDETGEFLVAALATELNPDIGISIPKFPITARQVLENMDGVVEAPDPVWKSRSMQYQVPHPRIIFHSVVNAKEDAAKAADQMMQTGWADDLGDEFERARAKVRSGQILVDYLHFLEGKNSQEFPLGSVYMAEDLIADLCFAMAAEQGVTLKGLRVRQGAQFTYDELMENLGGSIVVTAFEGALEYLYRVPPAHAIVSVVRSMMLVAEGKGDQLDEEIRKRFTRFAGLFAGLSDDEKRLVLYSAADVLDDLQTVVDTAKAQAVLVGGFDHLDELGAGTLTAGGNGHPAASDNAVAEEAAVEAA